MHAKFQVNPIYRKKVIQCIGFPIDIYSANTNTHNFLPVAWIDLKFHTHFYIHYVTMCEISSESLLQKKSYKMHWISHREFP